MNFSDYKIILASQSPRRQELLSNLDLEFETCPLDIDESYSEELKEHHITEYLVAKKAEAFRLLQPKELLITADTIVWYKDKALEKPSNEKEAIDMILHLSNTTHLVYSSFYFKTIDFQKTYTDSTLVTFDTISSEEATYYVKKHKPFDKAGAYGIQDWIGLAKIKSINGSFYTVMGLPTHLLYQAMNDLK